MQKQNWMLKFMVLEYSVFDDNNCSLVASAKKTFTKPCMLVAVMKLMTKQKSVIVSAVFHLNSQFIHIIGSDHAHCYMARLLHVVKSIYCNMCQLTIHH